MPDPNPLPIEETPEIVVEAPAVPPPYQPPPAAAPKQKTSFMSTIGALFLFSGLFVLGILLSGVIRKWAVPQQEVITESVLTPTPTPADPLAGWKIYQVVSGTTKLPIEGISFKLPPDILSPICDTTTCMSQGTYLPGGTRFTVAPRGIGQLLVDFRGSAISDVTGMVFTTQNTTVSGHAANLFTGGFAGRTVAGYGFSQMRGYMIEVTPSLSLEINHFIPTGISADFAADDTLFDQIVGTLILSGTPSATPVITQPPASATTSGY